MFFCIVEKYFCCSVRTGTIITALIELFLTLLSVIACFVVWSLNPEDKLDPLIFGLPLALLFVYGFVSVLLLVGVSLVSNKLLESHKSLNSLFNHLEIPRTFVTLVDCEFHHAFSFGLWNIRLRGSSFHLDTEGGQ